MKISIDTNILVRLFVADDLAQQQKAIVALDAADAVIVPTSVFCETVWVLLKVYQQDKRVLCTQLMDFVTHPKLVYDRPIIAAGLALMQQGGDFADGVNEAAGKALGAEIFVTFDRKAAKLLKQQGCAICIP